MVAYGHKIPSREEIFSELREINQEIEDGFTGDLIRGREDADKLLDLYIDLGYLAIEDTPPQGYQVAEN